VIEVAGVQAPVLGTQTQLRTPGDVTGDFGNPVCRVAMMRVTRAGCR
jgi:hypothetical protein